MRAVAVGLLIGIGLFCIWWSFWPRDERRSGSQRPGMRARLQDDITQAGYASVSPGNVLTACLFAGFLVFAFMQATTRVVPVAICFGVMAAYAPIAFVRMRARSRRSQLRDLWPEWSHDDRWWIKPMEDRLRPAALPPVGAGDAIGTPPAGAPRP